MQDGLADFVIMKVYARDIRSSLVRILFHVLPAGVLTALMLLLGADWPFVVMLGVIVFCYCWTVSSPYRSREEGTLWLELMRLSRRYADGERTVTILRNERIIFECSRKKHRSIRRIRQSAITRPQADRQRGVVPYEVFGLTDLWGVVRTVNGWPVERDSQGHLTLTNDAVPDKPRTRGEIRAVAEFMMAGGHDRPTVEELRELVIQLRAAIPLSGRGDRRNGETHRK